MRSNQNSEFGSGKLIKTKKEERSPLEQELKKIEEMQVAMFRNMEKRAEDYGTKKLEYTDDEKKVVKELSDLKAKIKATKTNQVNKTLIKEIKSEFDKIYSSYIDGIHSSHKEDLEQQLHKEMDEYLQNIDKIERAIFSEIYKRAEDKKVDLIEVTRGSEQAAYKYLYEVGEKINSIKSGNYTVDLLKDVKKEMGMIYFLYEDQLNGQSEQHNEAVPLKNLGFEPSKTESISEVKFTNKLNKRRKDVDIPLHSAVRSGNIKAINKLLKETFFVGEVVDSYGNNALHLASALGNMEVINLLLASKEFDINKKNDAGITALHNAAQQGNKTLVKLLIAKEADVTIRSQDGQTAENYAIANSPIRSLVSVNEDSTVSSSSSRSKKNQMKDEKLTWSDIFKDDLASTNPSIGLTHDLDDFITIPPSHSKKSIPKVDDKSHIHGVTQAPKLSIKTQKSPTKRRTTERAPYLTI